MCLDTFFRYYGNFVDMMRRARAPNKPRKSILNRDTRLNGCLLDLVGWITRYKHLYLCAYKYPEERLVRMHPGKALVAGAMVGSGLWLFGTPALSALGISVGTFLLSGGWKFMKLLFQTFPRDVRYRLTLQCYCYINVIEGPATISFRHTNRRNLGLIPSFHLIPAIPCWFLFTK